MVTSWNRITPRQNWCVFTRLHYISIVMQCLVTSLESQLTSAPNSMKFQFDKLCCEITHIFNELFVLCPWWHFLLLFRRATSLSLNVLVLQNLFIRFFFFEHTPTCFSQMTQNVALHFRFFAKSHLRIVFFDIGAHPLWGHPINLSLIHISEPTRPY